MEDLLLWRRLEYDFLAFVPCFLLFVFRFPFHYFFFFSCIPVCLSSCPFVCAAAICCSQQGRILYEVVGVLSACVICTLPHLGIILFFSSSFFSFVALISRVAFFLFCSRTRYASTSLAYLGS